MAGISSLVHSFVTNDHRTNCRVEFVKIALEYKPLNLGQGLPDDLIPNYVTKALAEVASSDAIPLQQYTRGFGHPRLINAISELYTKLLNRPSTIDLQTEVLGN